MVSCRISNKAGRMLIVRRYDADVREHLYDVVDVSVNKGATR